MKKHSLACLLALVLAVLCMLPAPAQATETHRHYICGTEHVSIGDHVTDYPSNWWALTPDKDGHVQWPTGGNLYYLTGNVVIDETWKVEPAGNGTAIIICLNGHSITMNGVGPVIQLGENAKLTITDCGDTGKITHKDGVNGEAVRVDEGGIFTMYGGSITGNHATGNGGGVSVNGTFKMYGGSITGNSTTGNGGGVYVGSNATVTIGGDVQITGNTAGSNTDSGIFLSKDKQLRIPKLIINAKIAVDNESPENYINGTAGTYTRSKGVLTAAPHKTHYLCGGTDDHTDCTSADCKNGEKVTLKAWTDSTSLPTSGNYYLATDVTLTKSYTDSVVYLTKVTDTLTLCLNGHSIRAANHGKAIVVANGGALTLTDCIGAGKLIHTSGYAGTGVCILPGGTFTMYSGIITGNNSLDDSGGVYNFGTFKLYGGSITGNSAQYSGGGVYNRGTFEMHGGAITGNAADEDHRRIEGGGGVYNRGVFEMTGGTIKENSSWYYGGGVYSGSNATTRIYGGSITHNEARQGGGVFAEPDNGVHLKGNVIIKNNGSAGTNDLLANTTHYLDGSLDSSSEIGLSVPSSTADGMKLLQPENCTIASDDLNCFFFNNKSAGYEMNLNSDGTVTLVLPHKHTLCNGTSHTGAGHSDSCSGSIRFAEWTDAEAQQMYGDASAKAANCLPTSGDWYLTQDVTLTEIHEVNGATLNLCLGGKSVNRKGGGAVFRVKNGGMLNLTDCNDPCGSITHVDRSISAGVFVGNGGGTGTSQFNLYNGKITGNSNPSGNGGGVCVFSDGQFNMYGGSITNNKAGNGGGVYVAENGKFTLSSKTAVISGNTATSLNDSINGSGGGVYVTKNATATISGGSITENKAAEGGGVYVDSSTTLILENASITKNAATGGYSGGGICVPGSNANVTIKNSEITENEARYGGGGMTVGACQVTLAGKVTIASNKTTDEPSSNLYIDKNMGGKSVILDDSFDSSSRVVFKDYSDQYTGAYYVSNTEALSAEQLACLTTDEGREFVKADDGKVYVATVLQWSQWRPAVNNSLTYNGTEQTGVTVPTGADAYYTIESIQAWQANAAFAQDSEYRSGYTAVVKLKPGYAWYDSTERTYSVADKNVAWSIAARKADTDDFVVDTTTLTATFGDPYQGVGVTVAKQYKTHNEDWTDKFEVQYKAANGAWTSTVPANAGTYQLQVHIAQDGNFAAGDVALDETLTISPASQAAPDGTKLTATAPTSIDGIDGKIIGVTTDMEYSTDNGQNWTRCTGGTISGSRGDYQIRYAANQNYKHSDAVTVRIPVHTHTLSGEVADDQHRKSEATCTSRAVYYQYCTICGEKDTDKTFEAGSLLPHVYDTDSWRSVDKTYHAHPCKNCAAYDESSKERHIYSGVEPGCKAFGCNFRRSMHNVTLTTNYPVDCSVTALNGHSVTNIVGGVEEGTAVTVSGNKLHIGDETFTFSTNNGAEYTYTFTGWTINGQPVPEGYTITGPITITANFDCVVNQYTVTWNTDGGTIQDTDYTSGKQYWGTQIKSPTSVVKAPDNSCSYTFTGWQDVNGNAPAATVTGNVTYTAQYTAVSHVYETGVWAYDGNGHWQICTVPGCGYTIVKEAHSYADADATVCEICGASRTLPVLTGEAEIIGELIKGERLTVISNKLPITATQLRYQWLRNGKPITGATDMAYTLTAADVDADISVIVTAVGHTGKLRAVAVGQVGVIYTVSYDTNGGTIGSLRQDRVKSGTDYTLPNCDFITAPAKMIFDVWEIDGVAYKAGTAYRVMSDVTVVALWKDAGSDKPDPTPDPGPIHRSPTIEAIPTADGRSATDYSGGIYGLTFRSTASFSSFLGVQVDGVTIDPSCYIAEEGSIEIYLKAVYLQTLKAGTHTITILSSEGDTTMEFTIGGIASSPKTSDAGMLGYAAMALLSLTGSALCLRRKEDEII